VSNRLSHGISFNLGANRRAGQLNNRNSANLGGRTEGRGRDRDNDGGLTNRKESSHISSIKGGSFFQHKSIGFALGRARESLPPGFGCLPGLG
jgi:hypothetical protein